MPLYCKRGIALVVFCFLFHGFSAPAQSGDLGGAKLTPEQQLEMLPNDSSRIIPIFRIAASYLYSDSAKTMYYIDKGLALARKYGRSKSVTSFLMLSVQLFVSRGRFDQAIPVLETADSLAIIDHNDYMIAVYEDERGNICNEQGDYPGAIWHNLASLRYAEKAKDTQRILVGLVNISVAYESEKNNKKGIEYAQKILRYPYNPRNVLAFTKALEMIASVDVQEHRYKSARDSLLKALRLYTAEKNDNGVATIYSELVSTYPGDPYHQFEYALPAEDLWERLGNSNGYAILNLDNLGGIYAYLAKVKSGLIRDSAAFSTRVVLNGQETAASRALREAASSTPAALREKARSWYTLSLARATKANDRQGIIQSSDSLSVLDAVDGRYREAFDYLYRHDQLYDSLFSQENKNSLAGIEADYKVELSDKELQLNKLALSDQIKMKWLLLGSLSLVLLVMVLIYRQSSLRKKNIASLSALNERLNAANDRLGEINRQLDEANEVKTRFVGILNHDLRAPVANLINILHLQKEGTTFMDGASADAHAKRIKGQAETLLETMEDLLSWSKGQMKNFQPQVKAVYVSDLFSDIGNHFSGTPGVTIGFEADQGMVVNTDEYFLKTILRNLTGNAIKSVAARTDGSVRWKAWLAGGKVNLSISDNGPGISQLQLRPLYDESLPSSLKGGLGLHLVRDLSKAIGCTISVSTGAGEGTVFTLTL